MSLSLDTVFQVVEIAQKAIEIYERIKDVPREIEELGERMVLLENVLAELNAHLRSKGEHALADLSPKLKGDMSKIIAATEKDCDRVYVLFDMFEQKKGPFGVQFKDNPVASLVAQAHFALGGPAKELEALALKIDQHCTDIGRRVEVMSLQGVQANHDLLQLMRKEIEALHSELKARDGTASPHRPAGATGSLSPPASVGKPAPKKPKPQPALSLPPGKSNFKVIFVDPHNLGRSICAETLLQLYRHRTQTKKGNWRIETIHSAGFFVKHRGDCTDLIENQMSYKFRSYKLAMGSGGNLPNAIATAAVFENRVFDDIRPFRTTLQGRVAARKSIGIRRDIFKTYDHIVVFTHREYDNMLALRSALLAAEGGDKAAAAAAYKGRVVHLGAYLTLDDSTLEIVDAPKNKEGVHTRPAWDKKVAQLKIALETYLRREMGWKPPRAQAQS
ncbi:uncharacterized protein JN550_004386 [Neoarthrinium moseri]|uniref:uncharacterized protein n=1 Tax=Neoarthrinium moseri TaxID=1658444 RepID=UPI001FDCEE92|nr:uncharacterized protein JN550_004386 [Neoarthrinium moseri]KAI1871392.1 hypothetical protein JN550_004386 [Neoarthrinium moseri]